MRWEKKGLVFCPSRQHPWMQTHAATPIPLWLGDDFYRVYFGTRDSCNRSSIGYVEFNVKSPSRILDISNDFILGAGHKGYFDDNGVYPGCIVEHKGELRMYYIGRNNGDPPLYYMSIGLAVSHDRGKTFRRLFKAPIMGRSEFDPWMVSTPFVMSENDIWRMWYLSGFKWDEVGSQSYYNIKYAESRDGISWQREGLICIELKENETNIASPTVLVENGIYKMWYSYVLIGQGYRIGYAESFDGCIWKRRDEEAGIDVSISGWDSQALSYPSVFSHHGRKYMLYSGNQFGRDGFGIAVEELKI